MPITPGDEWSVPLPPPGDLVICGSDAEARAVVVDARRADRSIPPVGLVGGDLWRTLGAPAGGEERLRSDSATAVPVDVVEVLLDGRPDWFVAHLLGRQRFWAGRVVAAMNVELLGRWKVAPRAHPGDGLLDVVDARLGVREKLQARRRLPAGAHLPHPAISVRRTAALHIDLDGMPTRLDGEVVGPVRQATLRVADHALTVVV